ncbi:hypothetical protein AMAG_05064 [Allomyces macrogynus ATCC 38327]|uniref:Uncharacterized protein n=1 Tax=Allomyces macrogynus (strain ATCC 38327) TaxID=578462 RepID=A0A0L0S7D7_ALLM3|nr:hypothetical protein AMAG_05064 [Allomyces macrogynus ATCC 38327]|eukprot:KNE58254.1 hypothetical protein AMAG_05064 [Allomyces macrogynus ATCC 38327]
MLEGYEGESREGARASDAQARVNGIDPLVIVCNRLQLTPSWKYQYSTTNTKCTRSLLSPHFSSPSAHTAISERGRMRLGQLPRQVRPRPRILAPRCVHDRLLVQHGRKPRRLILIRDRERLAELKHAVPRLLGPDPTPLLQRDRHPRKCRELRIQRQLDPPVHYGLHRVHFA